LRKTSPFLHAPAQSAVKHVKSGFLSLLLLSLRHHKNNNNTTLLCHFMWMMVASGVISGEEFLLPNPPHYNSTAQAHFYHYFPSLSLLFHIQFNIIHAHVQH
jgi:hypothetical protein